jgi:Flp pilus assembly protein TadD
VHKELSYTTEPASWGYLPHDFAAIAAFHLGLKDEALVHGQKALDLEPNDPRLVENMRWYRGEEM